MGQASGKVSYIIICLYLRECRDSDWLVNWFAEPSQWFLRKIFIFRRILPFRSSKRNYYRTKL